jgi:hypothetical protein
LSKEGDGKAGKSDDCKTVPVYIKYFAEEVMGKTEQLLSTFPQGKSK